MILYFDNYITDEPLHVGGHEESNKVRNSNCNLYKMPNKFDITLYTLASYNEIKWSEVIIKYELENPKQKGKFEKFVKKLFPKAHIIYGRSDSQKKFQDTIKLINTFKDDWIFYAGNNDHPFISPNTKTLYSCLKKAKELKKKNKWVSVLISHFPSFFSITKKGSPFREVIHSDVKLLEENKDFFVVLFPKGQYHSMQIIHKDLFVHWFFSGDSKECLVRRSEDMTKFTKTKNQVVIIPKRELCAHFDGEIHTTRASHNVSEEVSPPLFIPPGFFEKKINISFGYDEYREGWVNINPIKEKYSFKNSKHGTDLMIGMEDIPLFWNKRIKKKDINSKINKKEIKIARDKRFKKLRNSLPLKSNFYWIIYRSKIKFIGVAYKIPFLGKFLRNLLKKHKLLENIYKKTIKVSFK